MKRNIGFTYHHDEVSGLLKLVEEEAHGVIKHLGGNKIHGMGVR